jgi:hypothetical protein
MKKIIPLLVLYIISCDQKSGSFSVSEDLELDSLSSCPFLTSDRHINPVISYVTDINDSVSVMRYRISRDNGKTFGEPVEVSSSRNVHPHPENLPKIIFKPSGEIIAVWGSSNPNPENKYAGLIYYASSIDDGKSWSAAIPLVSDPGSYDQRYFDVDLLPGGEAAIIWLDNRESVNEDGSSVFFSSTKGPGGFKGEVKIAETICPCCRTELFVDKKGTVHACFRDIINDSIRDMVHVYSEDNGKSFSLPMRISADNWVINGCPHTGPTMTEAGNNLHFNWYTGGDNGGVYYCSSDDRGNKFSDRVCVSNKPSAKHPQITSLQNDCTGSVWDETIKFSARNNCGVFFQLRSNDGKFKTIKLSSDSLVSEFPVIRSTGKSSAIVAYTQKSMTKKSVCCKILDF